MTNALEDVDDMIAKIKEAESDLDAVTLTVDEKRFWDAFTVHWVHADKRIIMTEFLCRKLTKSLSE